MVRHVEGARRESTHKGPGKHTLDDNRGTQRSSSQNRRIFNPRCTECNDDDVRTTKSAPLSRLSLHAGRNRHWGIAPPIVTHKESGNLLIKLATLPFEFNSRNSLCLTLNRGIYSRPLLFICSRQMIRTGGIKRCATCSPEKVQN